MEDKVLDLAKRRGFIWGPSPNIYHGGVSGFYDWGPLGKLLKNKVENKIRNGFLTHNFWEVECPTIMPKVVWEASGHYEGFFDPIVKDLKTNSVYRADHLIKEENPNLKIDGLNFEELNKIIKQKKIKSPKGNELSDVQPYSLMMRTTLGLDQEAYLRPETATTTYLLFKEYYNFFRTKLPFSVFQIGKAYRNEISPRQGVLRTREFTQAEAQLFIYSEDENNFEKFKEYKNKIIPIKGKNKLKDIIQKKILKKQAYAYMVYVAYSIVKEMGFEDKNLRIRQHSKKELAHYAEDAWDIEINTKRFGWLEICGVHDRKNYDLKRHNEYAKLNLKKIPNILEIAFGIERLTYCLLEHSFKENKLRSWLNFNSGMSPIDVAVFPLVRKDKLPEKAKEIFKLLEKDFVCIYDETGSIGRLYRRMDEVGTSLCCTVDHESLKKEDVTIRDIKTMKQVRVKIKNLNDVINQLLDGKKISNFGNFVN